MIAFLFAFLVSASPSPSFLDTPIASTSPVFVPAEHFHVGPDSYYPNFALTPGAVFPDVTKEDVCTVGYTAQVRNVPESLKKQVFLEYGIPWEARGDYEVDHFISLELGGSNNIKNLWPEPYEPKPGARQKDVIETYLHTRVCKGEISLQEAQREISSDWYLLYEELKGGEEQ